MMNSFTAKCAKVFAKVAKRKIDRLNNVGEDPGDLIIGLNKIGIFRRTDEVKN